MRGPVTGEVHVHYGQLYVHSDPDGVVPDLSEAFAGQSGGLCGAALPGALWLHTGLHTGSVGFTVEVHDEAPTLGPAWEDVVEVSFRPLSESTCLTLWAGEGAWDLDLPLTDYRVRYCARGRDEGRRLDTRSAGEPEADRYLLQFWPAPLGPDLVVRQTSADAAYWHRYARERPPPPTPEEKDEAARLAREAEERARRELRSHYERWEWGGRLPSDRLRGHRHDALGLLRFDSDLVHTLDAADSEVQRAVALLAARRACEAAGLADVPWVADALTALAERRPLPPPFDDPAQLSASLRTDPRVPRRRTVREAIPPERPPYHPPPPPAASPLPRVLAAGPEPNRPERPGLGRPLATLVPAAPAAGQPIWSTGAAHGEVAVAPGARTPREPRRISQPHFAPHAVRAAAGADPLKAALDAVWHALNTYGEHYPRLLKEVRSVCAGHAGE
ncbi:hypothetical protein [Streptomyces tremellae]|uniref:Uncharacterized protein n=1 Tax=Streptomyces tremellae TaxID=1124239 RepID=A0ABP7EX76_9ACTN